jgi:hypothetical protein
MRECEVAEQRAASVGRMCGNLMKVCASGRPSWCATTQRATAAQYISSESSQWSSCGLTGHYTCMYNARQFTSRRWATRRSARRRRSSVLGWALLVLGLVVLIWRLRVDLGPRPHVAAIRVVPVTRPHLSRPAVIPTPLPATPTAVPNPEMPLQGGSPLSASRINAILKAYDSPLQGHGPQLVSLSRQYRVDDAVALAFFVMESRAGTRGEAQFTHNIGNLRPSAGADAAYSYSTYATWMDGATAWFHLMRSVYLNQLKLATVETVVPVYAPLYDGNDPVSMTAGIRQLVQCWRGMASACPSDPPGIDALVSKQDAPLRQAPRRH